MKTEIVVKPKQAGSSEVEAYKFRRFSAADLEQITRIYHSGTAMRSCAEVRSPTMWEWKPGGLKAKLLVLVNRRGKVIGYLALGTDWGRPCAHEIGVLNDEASKVIFDYILGIARSKGLKEFYCIISPGHPFARFAFWHDGEMRMRSGGGAGMARLLNLVTFMTKMEKEFESRLNCSELHDQECTLAISSEEGFAFLDVNRGCVSVSTKRMKSDYRLDIPLSCVNPLITGYKDIDELMKNPNVEVRGGRRAVRLIQVLFPSGLPHGGLLPLEWE